MIPRFDIPRVLQHRLPRFMLLGICMTGRDEGMQRDNADKPGFPDPPRGGTHTARSGPHAEACVAIVTYNSAECLPACIESLQRQQVDVPHNLVFFDNASDDASASTALALAPDCELLRSNVNLGFGRANNQALAGRREPYVVLVNPDCELHRGALRLAIDYLRAHPDVGLLGARLLDASGRESSADKFFTSPWREMTGLIDSALWRRARIRRSSMWWRVRGRGPARSTDWVIGAFMALPRYAWDEAGGFDPDFFMYGEDTDLCWRLRRRGYHVAIHPQVVGTHLGRHSTRPAFGETRRELAFCAAILAYTKRAGREGAERLVRAMRMKLKAKILLLGLRHRLLNDHSALHRRRRPEAVLAILEEKAWRERLQADDSAR